MKTFRCDTGAPFAYDNIEDPRQEVRIYPDYRPQDGVEALDIKLGDLLAFAAEIIRRRKIKELEEASPFDIISGRVGL